TKAARTTRPNRTGKPQTAGGRRAQRPRGGPLRRWKAGCPNSVTLPMRRIVRTLAVIRGWGHLSERVCGYSVAVTVAELRIDLFPLVITSIGGPVQDRDL